MIARGLDAGEEGVVESEGKAGGDALSGLVGCVAAEGVGAGVVVAAAASGEEEGAGGVRSVADGGITAACAAIG